MVAKIFLARVGMLVFAKIATGIRSPATLTPMLCGVTSSVEPIDEVAAREHELTALELAHQVNRAVGAGRDATLASASALATS